MEIGDKLRISERLGKCITISERQGIITLITNRTITILKEEQGNNTFKESFSLGDLVAEGKKFQLNIGGKWQEISFKQEDKKITYHRVIRK